MNANNLESPERKLVMWYKCKEKSALGLTKAQISRSLGLDVKTVRKYLSMSYDEFKLSIPKIYNLNDIEILNLYILVGGLPEIVKIFLETGDIEKVREGQIYLLEKLQKEIHNRKKL